MSNAKEEAATNERLGVHLLTEGATQALRLAVDAGVTVSELNAELRRRVEREAKAVATLLTAKRLKELLEELRGDEEALAEELDKLDEVPE